MGVYVNIDHPSYIVMFIMDSYGCGICVAPAGGREGDNAGAQAGTSGNDKSKHYNNIATNFLQET